MSGSYFGAPISSSTAARLSSAMILRSRMELAARDLPSKQNWKWSERSQLQENLEWSRYWRMAGVTSKGAPSTTVAGASAELNATQNDTRARRSITAATLRRFHCNPVVQLQAWEYWTYADCCARWAARIGKIHVFGAIGGRRTLVGFHPPVAGR